MDELKTINEVCKMLDLTSRTIRYYEQCRLIDTVRETKTAPRRLDEENILRLRKIRFLRKLGLSIDEIADIIDSDEKAVELIEEKTAEMRAEINAMVERVNLLREVLTVAEKGGNIYSLLENIDSPPNAEEMLRVGAEVTKLLLERRFDELKPYLNKDMNMLQPGFFEACWDDHIKLCGKFISIGKQKIVADTVINVLHYEKQDIAILTEVHAGIVTGMLLRYYSDDD